MERVRHCHFRSNRAHRLFLVAALVATLAACAGGPDAVGEDDEGTMADSGSAGGAPVAGRVVPRSTHNGLHSKDRPMSVSL